MKRLTPLWILILVIAAVAIYLPGLSKYLKLKRKETELSQKIQELQTQITALRNEEYLLKTDLAHLENAVRKELGLVKPGEIVVKVVEEEIPASAENASG